jgi:hypothetical protein
MSVFDSAAKTRRLTAGQRLVAALESGAIAGPNELAVAIDAEIARPKVPSPETIERVAAAIARQMRGEVGNSQDWDDISERSKEAFRRAAAAGMAAIEPGGAAQVH